MAVDINAVLPEWVDFCIGPTATASERVANLVKMGFIFVKMDGASFVYAQEHPPRFVTVVKREKYYPETGGAKLFSGCGLTAGGEISENSIRSILADLSLDPEAVSKGSQFNPESFPLSQGRRLEFMEERVFVYWGSSEHEGTLGSFLSVISWD